MKAFQLTLLLFLVSGLAYGRPAALTPECAQFITSLPPGLDHGFLEVPEDWDHPEASPKLSLFFTHWKTPDTSHAPVIFFNGGPGHDNHMLPVVLKDILPKLQTPFVFLDQRGTGCSSLYPIPYHESDVDRFQFYGTRSIVRDSEALRKKLFGEQKWKVFGQSFGGMIVHRYLSLYPQSIVSAHAHGFALTRNPLGDYYFRMKGQRRLSKAYFSLHPDEQKIVEEVRAQLSPQDCFAKGQVKLCGEGSWDGILVYWFNGSLMESTRSLLKKLLNADGKLDRKLYAKLVNDYVMSLYAPTSKNAFKLKLGSPIAITGPGYIGAMEMEVAENNPEDPNNCGLIQKALAQEGDSPDLWPVNECRFLAAMTILPGRGSGKALGPLGSKIKRDPLTLDNFLKSYRKNASVPFYLYSGELDTFVPKELFAEEAR